MKNHVVVVGVVALLGLALLGSAAPAADQKICAGCRRVIESGEYIRADGQYYHADHFICAYCRKPIGSSRYYEQNGLRYDSACFVNEISARCAYCRKPVGNNWVTFGGKEYHEACYDQFIALRCSFCGDIISGDYLRDQWGNSYHEYHKDEPRCLYCGRLISSETNGGERFGDGRCECGLCLENAVRLDSEAQSLMSEVRARLTLSGIEIDHDKLPLSLVDSKRLSSLHGSRRNDVQLEGLTQYEKRSWLGGLIDRVNFDIYILHSLPRAHFYATVAHELMHVWLTLNAPAGQNSAMVEGTCNYAAYLILEQLDDADANHLIKQMMVSSDPDYGEGFRKVKDEVDGRGLDGWLEFLRTNEQPPW